MNRGFLYGDGFFETIRVTNGSVPLLDFHLNRIYEALETYKLRSEVQIDMEFLDGICKSYEMPECIVRINFFRDGGGMYTPESDDLAFNHTAKATETPFFLPSSLDIFADIDQTPIIKGSIGYYPDPKPMNSVFRVKSLSSAYYVLASIYKVDQELDYLFLMNDKNEVCEEVTSNILLQVGNEFYTPHLDSGGVFGATLRYLMAAYAAEVLEKKITKDDIDAADKVFICKGSQGLIQIK
jgi:branched-chain amino acid aminotransferase